MKNNIIYLFIAILLSFSCDHLEVDNLNQADIQRVMGEPNGFAQLIESQYNLTWKFSQAANSSLGLDHAADGLTGFAPAFNIGIRAKEPREAVVNTQNNEPGSQTWYLEFPYKFSYSAISTANDILRALKKNPNMKVKNKIGGVDVDVTNHVKAQAYYIQGVSYGNLSMLFDKAKFVDEDIELDNVSKVTFSSYADLAVKAVDKLQKAIDIASSINPKNFVVEGYNGAKLNKDQFIRLVRTMQARILVNNARTDAENKANRWSKILEYASKGIEKDLVVTHQSNTAWNDRYKRFSSRIPFSYVDYRVISLIDSKQPSKFPQDGSHPLNPAKSSDKRLTTDMKYHKKIDMQASVGLYRFSHYQLIRYDKLNTGGTTKSPYILKAENDLIHAEALLHTGGGNKKVAELINNTRFTRGGLPKLTGNETKKELFDAMYYERIVELLGSNGGNTYYTRRRLPPDDGSLAPLTGLQKGTFPHYPIPAPQLALVGEKIYTFGGN